jgi:hypothetical protein
VNDPAYCPHCGAKLAPQAQWCSLCFEPVGREEPGRTGVIPATRDPVDDLPPMPPPDRPPVFDPDAAVPDLGPPQQEPSQPAPPKPAPDPDALDEWVAMLAAEEGGTHHGFVKALSRPGLRVVVGIGGALVLLLLLVAGSVLLSKVVG